VAPFNFAFHCHQLGHATAIVSRVGDDELGRELRDEVKRLGMSDEYIQTDREHPTGTVRVTVDASGQPCYEIVEKVAWDYIEPIPSLAAELVGFGTLGQRCSVSRTTIRSFVERTPLGVFDVNLRQHFFDRECLEKSLALATMVKVSEEEWPTVASSLDLKRTVEIIERFPNSIRSVIVSRGANGMKFVSRTAGESFDLPGVPIRLVDTVGAGDAFTAAMVCLCLEGKPLRACARFANRYAARVCEHRGGTPRIDRREIEALAARD
jgi:fructokinase